MVEEEKGIEEGELEGDMVDRMGERSRRGSGSGIDGEKMVEEGGVGGGCGR